MEGLKRNFLAFFVGVEHRGVIVCLWACILDSKWLIDGWMVGCKLWNERLLLVRDEVFDV